MNDVFVLLILSIVVAMVLMPVVIGLGFIWDTYKHSWTTGSARRPRSGATRMTAAEYAQRWETWNWEQRKLNREQSSSH